MTQNKRGKRIAITGGIGSGKSTVAQIIQEAGYPVFSCDEVYREVQRTEEYRLQITRAFGDVFTPDGGPDREKLAQIVFSDKEKLKELDNITHPMIMRELYRKMLPHPVSFAEVPLLFEGGYEKNFDGVIVVYRNLQERIAAVCARDHTDEQKTLARIKNQADYEKIIKEGHTVIYNDGDIRSLRKKVLSALEKIFG